MRSLFAIALAFLAASAQAQTASQPPIVTIIQKTHDHRDRPFDSVGSGATEALPLEELVSGTVRYVTGGVGDEERAQLASVKSKYNVYVLISEAAGAFVSGATVEFTDAHGAVVATVENAGPYLYVALPAGKYTLKATLDEVVKTSTLTVPENGKVSATVRF